MKSTNVIFFVIAVTFMVVMLGQETNGCAEVIFGCVSFCASRCCFGRKKRYDERGSVEAATRFVDVATDVVTGMATEQIKAMAKQAKARAARTAEQGEKKAD